MKIQMKAVVALAIGELAMRANVCSLGFVRASIHVCIKDVGPDGPSIGAFGAGGLGRSVDIGFSSESDFPAYSTIAGVLQWPKHLRTPLDACRGARHTQASRKLISAVPGHIKTSEYN
jgi:hypothetical protein